MARKKLLVLILMGLFLIPATINVGADTQLGVFVSPDNTSVKSGWYAGVEALFLQPHIKDPLAVIEVEDDDDSSISSDSQPDDVPLENAGWGRNGGFRAAIGKRLPNRPWDVKVEFTYINGGSVKDLFGTDDEPVSQVFSRRHQHDQRALNVRSETHLEVMYGDLMATHSIKIGDDFLFSTGGGLRFSYVRNDRLFTATGKTCGSANILANPQKTIFSGCAVAQRQRFWGVGPRLNAQMGWQVGDSLNLFGNLGFALLAGEMDRRTDEHAGGSFNSQRTILREQDGKITQVFDTQIGLNYHSGNLNIKLGYELQNWLDMHDRTTPSFSDDDTGAIQNVDVRDIGFEGPFVRATLGF